MPRAGSLRRIALTAGIILALVAVAVPTWRMFRPLPSLKQIRDWVDQGKLDQAQANLTEYLSRRPGDPDALMLAARVAAAQEQFERCVELLDQVPRESIRKPEALLRQGQALRAIGYGRRAEQAWRALMELAEERGLRTQRQDAIAELLSLQQLERRVSEILPLMWDMYPEHREKWRLLIIMGWMQGKGVEPKQAIRLLDPLIQLDPTDLDARRARAAYQARTLQWKEAASDAQYCLERNPNDVRSLETLLECYLAEHDWDAMDPFLAPAQLHSAASPVLWRLRGEREREANNQAESEACFQEALRIKPLDPETHFQYAQLLLRHGQRQQAEEHLDLFRRLQEHQKELDGFISTYTTEDSQTWTPPPPPRCVEMAEHCRVLGRLHEARAWLIEALRQQPNFADALDGMERLAEASVTAAPSE